MKNHSRTHGNKGTGYRTPSRFRSNTLERLRDQKFRSGLTQKGADKYGRQP